MPAVSFLPTGVWPDGTTQGAWFAAFNGYGSNTSVSATHFTQKPQVVYSSGATSAALITTTASYDSSSTPVDITVTTVNAQQLRQGSPPNAWEAPWIFFAHDTVAAGPNGVADSYYVTVGTDRLSLGRVTSGNGGLSYQCFLYDDLTAGTPVGVLTTIRIVHTGNNIKVYKDGVLKINVNDGPGLGTCSAGTRPPVKYAGKVGLYTEDAEVTWSNMSITNTVNAPVWTTSTKTVSPASVTVGGTVTYTITAKNSGTASGSAVITDNMPSNFSGAAWAAPGCTPSSGTGNINTTTPVLAPGASATITVVGTAIAAGTLAANTAVIAGNNITSPTVTVTAAPPPACGPGSGTPATPVLDWLNRPSCGTGSGSYKSVPAFTAQAIANANAIANNGVTTNWLTNFPPRAVYSGGQTSYYPNSTMSSLKVNNMGNGAVTVTGTITYWTTSGTLVTIPIPPLGVPQGTIAANAIPLLPSGTPANMDPLGAFSITLNGSMTGNDPFGASLMSFECHIGNGNAGGQAGPNNGTDVPCGTGADIPCGNFSTSIKTVSSSTVNVGDPITYTIVVKNTGAGAASTTVTDSVPVGLTNVTWSSIGSTPPTGTGNVISLNTGSIPAGGQRIVSITGTTTTVGTIAANTAVVGGNNVTSPPVTVSNRWTITKSHPVVGYAVVGQIVTWTITVRNNGSIPASAQIVDHLPFGIVNGTWSAPGATPPNGIDSMITTTPLIAPGATYTMTMTGQVNIEGVFTNTVSVDDQSASSNILSSQPGVLLIDGTAPAGTIVQAFQGTTLVNENVSNGNHSMTVPTSFNTYRVTAKPPPGKCVRATFIPCFCFTTPATPGTPAETAISDWAGRPSCGPGSGNYKATPGHAAQAITSANSSAPTGVTANWTTNFPPRVLLTGGGQSSTYPISTLPTFCMYNMGDGSVSATVVMNYWKVGGGFKQVIVTVPVVNISNTAPGHPCTVPFPTIPVDADPTGVFSLDIYGTMTGTSALSLASIIMNLGGALASLGPNAGTDRACNPATPPTPGSDPCDCPPAEEQIVSIDDRTFIIPAGLTHAVVNWVEYKKVGCSC